MIVLSDVHKALNGRPVLKGLSLHVAPGETLVIIGRSGIGKSVTLRTVVGLLPPDRGTVRVAGVDLGRAAPRELAEVRKKIGFLFQSGALLNSATVAENVALPLLEHERLPQGEVLRVVRRMLSLVELEGVEEMMPGELSIGMRKRVGLARAIVRNPEILLYDEPTSGLDPITSQRINDLILNLQRELKVTSVVVTHDLPSAYRVADRIAMLHDGVIVGCEETAAFQRSADPVVREFLDAAALNGEADAAIEI